jgi:hypothetical protein
VREGKIWFLLIVNITYLFVFDISVVDEELILIILLVIFYLLVVDIVMIFKNK